jgi:hypothetical protein
MASPTPIHWLLRRVAGGYYRLCGHRSHRWGLPCFRGFFMDGLCGHHWDRCYQGCARPGGHETTKDNS